VLAKSKNFKHGNVSAQSIGGSGQSISATVVPKPIISFKNLSAERLLDTSIKLSRINLQQNVEEFDKVTGINSNSPEIIAFSNFIPVYDKNGELNEFGDYLKKKQDAYLIRASSNISNLISNSKTNALIVSTASNALAIQEFCKNHGKGIDELLNHFSFIRKKMDFRSDIDKEVLKIIGLLPQDVILNDINSPDFFANSLPHSVEEILNESNDVIKHWTPTKIWIQSCLELKEVLMNGLAGTFLSEGDVLGG